MPNHLEDVIIHEIDGTPEECAHAAWQMANDTSRETLPVRVFSQGPRTMVSAVMPVRVLVRVLAHNSTLKGVTAATAVTAHNRPVDKKHVQEIKDYLLTAIRENRPYILPPLTINATKGLEVYVPKGRTGPITGWGILPDEQNLLITDGQHRFMAIQSIREEITGSDMADQFLNAGVAVMITLSDNIEEVHQDFADAAKSKPLPPSLVAVYDLRHPGNRAVLQLIERCQILKGRVDATSSTLSINSPYLFLANQVRQFVKSSLTGKPSVPDDAFYASAKDQLTDQQAFKEWVESRIAFLDALVEVLPDWKDISRVPTPGGPEGPIVYREMKRIRENESVAITAAALNALGLVSFDLLNYTPGHIPTTESLVDRLRPLSQIDWRRSAPIWQGSLVQNHRVTAQTGAVRAGAQQLLEAIRGKHKSDLPEERNDEN